MILQFVFRFYSKTKSSYEDGPSTTSEPICIPLLLPLVVLFHIKLWDLRLLSRTTTPVPFDLRVSLSLRASVATSRQRPPVSLLSSAVRREARPVVCEPPADVSSPLSAASSVCRAGCRQTTAERARCVNTLLTQVSCAPETSDRPPCLHVYVITWPRRGTASMSKRSCVWRKWHTYTVYWETFNAKYRL